MAWIDTARNITEGFANAAGATQAASDLRDQRMRQQGFEDLQRQQGIQQAQAASLNIAAALRSGINPDTNQPLTADERQKLLDANHLMSAHITDLFNTHVDPNRMGPGVAGSTGATMPESGVHKVTDFLHLTKPPTQGATSPTSAMSQVQDILAKYGAPAQEEKNPYIKYRNDLIAAGYNPDKAQSLTVEKMRKDAGEKIDEAENWQNFNLTMQDGTTIPVQKNTKDGRVNYLDGNPVPSEVLRGAKSASTRVLAPKGLSLENNTGQIVNKDTGERYSPGDPNNPPEVKKMFEVAAQTLKDKQNFQNQLADRRSKGYTAARLTNMMQAIDTWNGNAPAFANGFMMLAQPGRFLPAGPAATAISQQTFIGDITGASAITRNAINNVAFTEDMRAKIAFALRDENRGAIDTLLASNVLGTLTKEQRDFVIAIGYLKEQAMSLRATMKQGQGSDQTRQAIFDVLPGVLSPDRDYALRQLDQFDAQIARIQRGVPKVPLNESATTQNLPGVPKGSTRYIVDQGPGKNPRVFTIKNSDKEGFLKDFPNARPAVQ